MKDNFKKRAIHIIISTLFFVIILAVFCFLEYIDFSVITAIYLPIWIVGIVTILLGKIVFAEVVLIFTSIGLIVEYIVHIYKQPYPDMSGAFLNTAILIIGLIVGIVLQILSAKKQKDT